MSRTSRRRTKLATLAILAGLLTVGLASPAHASGYGWALSHGAVGATTLQVTGNGLFVEKAQVSHDEGAAITNVCKPAAKVWGTLHAGGTWSKTYGQESGCVFHGFVKTTEPRVNFKAGTSVKGQAIHDGGLIAGIPTVAIS